MTTEISDVNFTDGWRLGGKTPFFFGEDNSMTLCYINMKRSNCNEFSSSVLELYDNFDEYGLKLITCPSTPLGNGNQKPKSLK